MLRSGSPMWPMVPTVHHVYRLWQLSRGGVLVAVLKGPAYLQYLQVSAMACHMSQPFPLQCYGTALPSPLYGSSMCRRSWLSFG